MYDTRRIYVLWAGYTLKTLNFTLMTIGDELSLYPKNVWIICLAHSGGKLCQLTPKNVLMFYTWTELFYLYKLLLLISRKDEKNCH